MAEHSASVTVKAPAAQVYTLFSHLNDFPKFMRFVKEVTYYDEQRTHWVVHMLKDYEWDAVNEDWIPNQQIGWRSTSGLRTSGRVKFRAMGPERTIVDVYIHYLPPTGTLGKIGDALGGGSLFDTILKEDLNHFAQMVEQAAPGALDPMSSHYLFHPRSAVASKVTTPRQNRAMQQDPKMSPEALAERQARIEREKTEQRRTQQEQEANEKRRRELEQQTRRERQVVLEQVAARRRQEEQARAEEEEFARLAQQKRVFHPVYDTIGGRDASRDGTALGDRDAIRPRHLHYEQDPMTARYPLKKDTQPLTGDEPQASPWHHSIRGTSLLPLPPSQDPDRSKQP
jgi:Polyketide cyclase / dehydrase and lipid transport